MVFLKYLFVIVFIFYFEIFFAPLFFLSFVMFTPLIIVVYFLIFNEKGFKKQVADLLGLFLISFSLCALSSPLHGLVFFLHNKFGVTISIIGETKSFLWVWDLVPALTGVLYGISGIFILGFWQLRHLRQIKNIPKAKVNSVAIGLAELHGRIRKTGTYNKNNDLLIPSNAVIYYKQNNDGQVEKKMSAFYLEDDTGKILVDPAGATITTTNIWNLNFLLRKVEILLTNRIRHITSFAPGLHWLEEGDEIYVIGTVERNPNADLDSTGSAALIMRRKSYSNIEVTERQIIFGLGRLLKQKYSYQDIFFISDAEEKRARKYFLNGMRKTICSAIILIFISMLLGVAAYNKL